MFFSVVLNLIEPTANVIDLYSLSCIQFWMNGIAEIYIMFCQTVLTHGNVFLKAMNRNCVVVTCQLTSEYLTVQFSFKGRLSILAKGLWTISITTIKNSL